MKEDFIMIQVIPKQPHLENIQHHRHYVMLVLYEFERRLDFMDNLCLALDASALQGHNRIKPANLISRQIVLAILINVDMDMIVTDLLLAICIFQMSFSSFSKTRIIFISDSSVSSTLRSFALPQSVE
jgi:hypothetical protein